MLVNRQTIVSTIVCVPANIASCKRYGKTLMKLRARFRREPSAEEQWDETDGSRQDKYYPAN